MSDKSLNEERYMILKMLEEGKISAEEATALLQALEESAEDSQGAGYSGEDAYDDEPGCGARSERAGRRRRSYRQHRPRRPHRHPGFDREAFRESMGELRCQLEKIRTGAVEIGDEVSRQVQDAMETWRAEWRRGGDRRFRHFVRNMGDVFHVPFGKAVHEEKFERELEVEPDEAVRVSALSGDVEVETWDKDAVRVEALKKVWARTEEEAAERSDDYRIYVEREDNEVCIGARLAEEAPGWLPARCTIDYRIRVPAGASVATDVINGDVTVAGVRGGVDLKGTNGKIAARDFAGAVRIYSTNGDITLSAVEAAELNVRTVNGDVDLDLAGLEPGEHAVSTVHGDVDLTVPADVETDLHATTMHGDITYGFPGTVASRTTTWLHARLGRKGDAGAGEAASGEDAGAAAERGAARELNVRAVFGDIAVRPRGEGNDK